MEEKEGSRKMEGERMERVGKEGEENGLVEGEEELEEEREEEGFNLQKWTSKILKAVNNKEDKSRSKVRVI